jgi:hypothetical protein
VSSSPWSRIYPQRGFSRAIRTTKATSTSSIGAVRSGSVGPSSANEAAMPAQDRVGRRDGGDAVRGATAARGRRTRLGPPSPSAAVGWCGAGRRLRAGARGARRPWRRMCGTTAGPTPSTCRNIEYSNRLDTPGSCPTSNHRWSTARPDFWHPTGNRAVVIKTPDQEAGTACDEMASPARPRLACGTALRKIRYQPSTIERHAIGSASAHAQYLAAFGRPVWRLDSSDEAPVRVPGRGPPWPRSRQDGSKRSQR